MSSVFCIIFHLQYFSALKEDKMAKANKNDRFNDTFPTRLRQLVKEKGVTQAELASLLGISRQSFSAYCDGNTQPNIENTVKMAEYFGVSVDYLFGLSDIRATDPATKSLCESLGLSEISIANLNEDPAVSRVVDFLLIQHEASKKNYSLPILERAHGLYKRHSIILEFNKFLDICDSKNDAVVSLSPRKQIFINAETPEASPNVLDAANLIQFDAQGFGSISVVRYCANDQLTLLRDMLQNYLADKYAENIGEKRTAKLFEMAKKQSNEES